MSNFTSSLQKTEDGLPAIQPATVPLITGLRKRLTRAEFDAAIAAERLRIQGNSVGIYRDGEQFDIINEGGYRTLSLGTGGTDAANAAATHARTVNIGMGKSYTLIADTNVAYAGIGLPAAGLGNNNDIFISWDGLTVFLKIAGSWVATLDFASAHYTGYIYKFDSGIVEQSPSMTHTLIRTNNATPAQATFLYVSNYNQNDINCGSQLAQVAVGQVIRLESTLDETLFFAYKVTSVTVGADYRKLGVVLLNAGLGATFPTGVRVKLEFLPGLASSTIDGATDIASVDLYNRNTSLKTAIQAAAASGGGAQGPVGAQGPAGPGVDVQFFSASGTWTKPTTATPKLVRVYLGAGGGGGGPGFSIAAIGTAAGGGAGGGGGSVVFQDFSPEQLGATEAVTIGAAGVGGIASTTSGAGAYGTGGGNSLFGSRLFAGGGGRGAPGNTGNTGGGAGGSSRAASASQSNDGFNGYAGAANSGSGAGGYGTGGGSPSAPFAGAGGGGGGNSGTGYPSGFSQYAGGSLGGGGGGGISSAGTQFAGGGTISGMTGSSIGGGAVGGGAGVANTTSTTEGSNGASGGGANSAGNGGAGGTSVNYSGGGGGGGASATGIAGNGGSGAPGFCRVVTFF